MTIILDVSEDIAEYLRSQGDDPSRVALEGMALQGYRSRTLSEEQVRRLLGLATRIEVHDFLKRHDVFLNYTLEVFQRDSSVPLSGSPNGTLSAPGVPAS